MKTFCFDFDGTIADTIPLIVKTVDYLLKKRGDNEISEDLLRRIREEGIEEALKEMNVPIYRLLFLYLQIKKEMNKGLADVAVNANIKDVLVKLRNDDYRLGILTSNSEENVRKFLEKNNLNYFDFIKTSGVLGKAKKLKKLKKKDDIFVYIGDETRDIRAGKRAKVKTVGVSWGLSSRKALLRARPDALVEDPQDLLNLSF